MAIITLMLIASFAFFLLQCRLSSPLVASLSGASPVPSLFVIVSMFFFSIVDVRCCFLSFRVGALDHPRYYLPNIPHSKGGRNDVLFHSVVSYAANEQQFQFGSERKKEKTIKRDRGVT